MGIVVAGQGRGLRFSFYNTLRLQDNFGSGGPVSQEKTALGHRAHESALSGDRFERHFNPAGPAGGLDEFPILGFSSSLHSDSHATERC